MNSQTLSQATRNEAFTMAMQGHRWHRGRSKKTGAPFYLIPSRSVPGTAHRTTSYGCTCTGYDRNGDCAHTEAVRIFEAGEQAARKPVSRYALLAGCSARNCDNDREAGDSRYCSNHVLVEAFG